MPCPFSSLAVHDEEEPEGGTPPSEDAPIPPGGPIGLPVPVPAPPVAVPARDPEPPDRRQREHGGHSQRHHPRAEPAPDVEIRDERRVVPTTGMPPEEEPYGIPNRRLPVEVAKILDVMDEGRNELPKRLPRSVVDDMERFVRIETVYNRGPGQAFPREVDNEVLEEAATIALEQEAEGEVVDRRAGKRNPRQQKTHELEQKVKARRGGGSMRPTKGGGSAGGGKQIDARLLQQNVVNRMRRRFFYQGDVGLN